MTLAAPLNRLRENDVRLGEQAPRLTKLELHGFKSFATRTVFAFEPGITAIVGPNGSGKSNVADAVRWVLGEQGQSALRAKRTEDVIFAGGQGRAPAGLAEATLTFDNSERWLPIEFTEVTVTRRAFRSGENHYLINGKRVRLKDVALLTASLGQSHVVVGQGLVDAALSQRAEERRSLFEHAADLAGLRLKVAEAERNLTETESNSERLHDLMAELEPRLKSLERAARQAREWQSLRDRLEALQRTHYGRQLRAAVAREEAAAGVAGQRQEAVRRARAALDHLTLEAGILSSQAERARAALAEHDAARTAVGERLRTVEHERDLAAERAAALGRRYDDMADTRDGLETRAAAVGEELTRVEAEIERVDQAIRQAEAQARAQEASLLEQRQDRQRHDARLRELLAEHGEAERQLAACDQSLALLQQRAGAAEADRQRILAESAGRRERLERLEREHAEADIAEHDTAGTLRDLEQRLAGLATAGEHAANRLAATVAGLADRERALGHATTRHEALTRMQQSGAGLHAGVREVTTLARDGRLTGVLGTVAELIEAPAELDTAIEIALGGHLQDIVVERWADAEAAIAHLKQSRSGRATFQPLDTVRAGRGREARIDLALGLPGTRGIAAELVGSSDQVRPVVEALLGRTLVVEDLPAARQSLPHLPGGWSAVTLGGEITRSGGSVTGGTAARESGLLARERDLRHLPAEIDRLRDALARDEAARAAAAAEVASLDRSRRDAMSEHAALTAAAAERRRQRDRLTAWVAELRRELEQSDDLLRNCQEEAAAIAGEQETVARRLTGIATANAVRPEQIASVTATIEQVAAALSGAEQQAAALSQRRAGLAERLRSEQRRRAELRNQERALADELTLRAERAAALERERAGLQAAHGRLVTEADALRAELATLGDDRFPLHAEQRRLDAALAQSNRSIAAAREALLDRERELGAGQLTLERARDEANAIRRQVTQELDVEDPDTLVGAEVGDDGHADDDQAREREISRLRDRLRRVGFVGQDIVTEYEREAEHHQFVRRQLADVHGAATSLRALLADLQGTMRSRFDATFARVSEEFSEVFSVLFGGGTAQLMLTGGDENGTRSEPGVDIVAQPPGKRLQSLALLSGGERALTAVALLFAILRVNPAPFCLLDEVDAALDEANVVRFRDQLAELAAKTQVIIVTHNRGTIETADTLYGVSMAADGVSRVLSMRMTEEDDPLPT